MERGQKYAVGVGLSDVLSMCDLRLPETPSPPLHASLAIARKSSTHFTMKLFLSTFLINLLWLTAEPAIAGTPLFVSCDWALDTPPFHRLQAFYSTHPDEPKPDECLSLNSAEFLVTVSGAGRMGQGLYYFDADTDAYEFPDGHYRAGTRVDREFDGPENRRFAILKTSNLHSGSWDRGFEVLWVGPRGNGCSFNLQELLWANEDPETGMCGSRIESGTAADVTDLRMEHEGTAATSIVFAIISQDCPDGPKRSIERRFVWSSGGFREDREK